MKLAWRKWFVLVLVFVSSCSGGGGGGSVDPSSQCTQSFKNEFVYELLNDRYLWYNLVEQGVDPAAYPSPQALLDNVTPDIDRWSYVISAEQFQQYQQEGVYPGMGCSVEFDRNKNLWVRFVYDGSPADQAGIKRSDAFLSINGNPVSSLPDLDAVWDEVNRPDSANIEILSIDGTTRTVTLNWDWVTITPILHREVYQAGASRVGYLVFKTFIEPAEAKLDDAFTYFRQQGIDELILDLRYNGGGRGSVALYLASLIGGVITEDKIFRTVIHNDRYHQYDTEIQFAPMENALSLDRVFVITTGNTCSASESVIQGLKPFVTVIQVGTTTCGKPVGMYAHDFCDQVVLPIEFRSANANGETNYFNGLAPTCPAADDLTRQMGDPLEESLQTALFYISNDACPAQMRSVMSFQDEGPGDINALSGFRRELGAF